MPKRKKRAGANPVGRRRRSRGRTVARRSPQRTQRRLEALLDRIYGRHNDYFDQRNQQIASRGGAGRRRGYGPRWRLLRIDRNRDLFDRLVLLDFEYLLSRHFAAGTDTLRCLLPQSVLGRAQNGHGWFTDEDGTSLCFREATFDRILTALERVDPGLKNYLIREQRSSLLERLRDYVLANLDTDELLLEIDGQPLLGVELLRGVRVATPAFLTGLVLAGFMDDFGQRQMTVSHFGKTFAQTPLRIGGGQQYIVRPERLAACGIVDPGAVEFSDRDLRDLRELGVIVAGGIFAGDGPVGENRYRFPEYDQAFFRRMLGDGISDDLALLYIGARFGFDALLGAFVMDGIDTYDKHLRSYAETGFDTLLAKIVQERWQTRHGDALVGGETILEVIRAGAKLNVPTCPLSSSHRRFIQYERGADVPTLMNHWAFLQGQPVWDIALGYNRFPGREFYSLAAERFRAAGLSVPPVTMRRPRVRDGA